MSVPPPPSPSQEDGISAEVEATQLAFAADLIRESASALRVPHAACVAAQLLLHRFYTSVSLKAHSSAWASGACILLSAKLCDEPRSVRHVANVVYDRLRASQGTAKTVAWRGEQRRRPLDFYGAAGYDWKHELVATERHVLKELGFRLQREVPHKLVLIFVNTLRDKADGPAWTDAKVEPFRRLLQSAWNYANDAMRVRVCAVEEARVVACACIALAAEREGEKLPEGWMQVFGCSEAACVRAVLGVRAGYRVETTDRLFVDYSLSEAFREFHPRGEMAESGVVGAKRGGANGSQILQEGLERRKKRSRFEDKETGEG